MDFKKIITQIVKENKIYVVLMILSGILPILNIYILQEFLNNISILSKNRLIYFNTFIIEYLVLMMVSYFLKRYLSFLSEILQLRVGRNLVEKIINSSNQLTLEEFENPQYQNKIRRVMDNSLGILVSTFTSLISMISIIFALSISVVYLARWNLYIVLIFVFFPFVFYKIYLKVIQKSYSIDLEQTSKKKENWYITFLLTQDSAFKENKIFEFSNYLLSKYQKNVDSFLNDSKVFFKYSTIWSILPEFTGIFIIILFLYYIFYSLESGTIFIGNVVAILQLVYQILDLSKNLSGEIISIKKNQLYINELIELLQYQEKKYKKLQVKVQDLVLQNVSYQKSNKKILKNINLKLEQGIYFLVGENGSGKSTLLNIISGLYQTYEGLIYINKDIPIKAGELTAITSQLFQDFKKYEYSFSENIVLGDHYKEYDIGLINYLINKCELEERVKNLSKGVHNNLGNWFENSEELSGGEWQKLSLARTLFKQADIYLLDEPNSMLDNISSKRIYEFLKKYLEDKIVVISTHKFDFIGEEDNVIFIRNGYICGVDKHKILLEKKEYKELIFS